jgi:hypothetical protein
LLFQLNSIRYSGYDPIKEYELYELGADLKDRISMEKYIENKNSLPINHEKAVNYILYLLDYYKNDQHPKNNFQESLKKHLTKISWREKYHQCWLLGGEIQNELNEKVLTLLLVSKHRRESKLKEKSFLVRGITINIIQHLCHLYQLNNNK